MSTAGSVNGNILRGLLCLLVVPKETSSSGITLERVWRSLVGADTKSRVLEMKVVVVFRE